MGSLRMLVTWLSQLVLWVVFANNVGFREIGIGSLAAAISTYFVFLFLHGTRDRFRLQNKYSRQIVHVPAILFSGTWVLLCAIALKVSGRKIPSQIVAVHFRPGGNDAASKGRRALAITYLNLAPNNLVLGILQDQRVFFFHTVIPRPLPAFLFEMGAELSDNS
jgi:multisubunit Na+/H+ antiporter MnhE subunit